LIFRYSPLAVGAELSEIGDEIIPIGVLRQSGKNHFRPRDFSFRIGEVCVERCLVPGDAGVLVRIGVIITRNGTSLAPDQAVQLRPDDVLGAFADLVADLALLVEDRFAGGDIRGRSARDGTDPSGRGLLTFTGDGTYDRAHVLDAVLARNPAVQFIVLPCKGAVLRSTARTAPTQRDSHIRSINEHGRMNWQKTSGYNRRSKVEAAIGRYKRLIGDALRSREDARRVCEVKIAVKVLNRMMELGRPVCVRVA
jgi:hypothetical protein